MGIDAAFSLYDALFARNLGGHLVFVLSSE